MCRNNDCVALACSCIHGVTERAMDIELESVNNWFFLDGEEEAGAVYRRAFGHEGRKIIVIGKLRCVVEIDLWADGHGNGVLLTNHVAALRDRRGGRRRCKKGEVCCQSGENSEFVRHVWRISMENRKRFVLKEHAIFQKSGSLLPYMERLEN